MSRVEAIVEHQVRKLGTVNGKEHAQDTSLSVCTAQSMLSTRTVPTDQKTGRGSALVRYSPSHCSGMIPGSLDHMEELRTKDESYVDVDHVEVPTALAAVCSLNTYRHLSYVEDVFRRETNACPVSCARGSGSSD